MTISDITPQDELMIGQRLREARAASGLTQQQVANQLGIYQSRLSMMERGFGANAIVLLRLAQLYGTTTDYLIGGEAASRSAA